MFLGGFGAENVDKTADIEESTCSKTKKWLHFWKRIFTTYFLMPWAHFSGGSVHRWKMASSQPKRRWRQGIPWRIPNISWDSHTFWQNSGSSQFWNAFLGIFNFANAGVSFSLVSNPLFSSRGPIVLFLLQMYRTNLYVCKSSVDFLRQNFAPFIGWRISKESEINFPLFAFRQWRLMSQINQRVGEKFLFSFPRKIWQSGKTKAKYYQYSIFIYWFNTEMPIEEVP